MSTGRVLGYMRGRRAAAPHPTLSDAGRSLPSFRGGGPGRGGVRSDAHGRDTADVLHRHGPLRGRSLRVHGEITPHCDADGRLDGLPSRRDRGRPSPGNTRGRRAVGSSGAAVRARGCPQRPRPRRGPDRDRDGLLRGAATRGSAAAGEPRTRAPHGVSAVRACSTLQKARRASIPRAAGRGRGAARHGCARTERACDRSDGALSLSERLMSTPFPLAFATAILAACASTSAAPAFRDTARLVEARTGHPIFWNQGGVADDAVARRVHDMLGRDLSVDMAIRDRPAK